MTIEIRPVKAREILDQMSLLEKHWEEIALNKQVMVLKPDEQKYMALEASDQIFALGAFDGDVMVGYSASFVFPHLHYSDLVSVINDVLYVLPSHRKGRAGLRLIRETERIAKERGAQMVAWHAKENTVLAELLPQLGYGVQDIIFSKGV